MNYSNLAIRYSIRYIIHGITTMCQNITNNSVTNHAELYVSAECDISPMTLLVIRCIIIAMGISAFIASTIKITINWQTIKKKKISSKVFLFLSAIQNLVMVIRPTINIVTVSYAWQNLWHLYVINLSAYCATCIIIFFVYIEVKIIKNSKLGKKNPMYDHFIRFIYVLPIIQLFLYSLFPIGFYYNLYSANLAFWIPTLIIVLIIIPPLTICGLAVYLQINKMQDNTYQKLKYRILVMIILCTILGGTVCLVAVITFFNVSFNWIMVELPWIFFIPFNCILIGVISHKQAKYRINKPTSSGPNTSDIKPSVISTASTVMPVDINEQI